MYRSSLDKTRFLQICFDFCLLIILSFETKMILDKIAVKLLYVNVFVRGIIHFLHH